MTGERAEVEVAWSERGAVFRIDGDEECAEQQARMENKTTTQESTMSTTTITQRKGIGYRGKLGQKAYMARINGSDSHYGLDRTFLDADSVSRDRWNRAKYVLTLSYDLTPGLYEEQSENDRRIIMVYATEDGGLAWTDEISDTRISAIVKRLDAGDDFATARKDTDAL